MRDIARSLQKQGVSALEAFPLAVRIDELGVEPIFELEKLVDATIDSEGQECLVSVTSELTQIMRDVNLKAAVEFEREDNSTHKAYLEKGAGDLKLTEGHPADLRLSLLDREHVVSLCTSDRIVSVSSLYIEWTDWRGDKWRLGGRDGVHELNGAS